MTLNDRALRAFRAASGDASSTFAETLPPVTLSARALCGQSPFAWTSTIFAARRIDSPLAPDARSSIELWKRDGRLVTTLASVSSFAFYVECDVSLSHAQMAVRWDANVSNDPADGRATYDSSAGVWFFATPFVTRPAKAFVTIDAQVPGAPDDAVMTMHRCTFLGFR